MRLEPGYHYFTPRNWGMKYKCWWYKENIITHTDAPPPPLLHTHTIQTHTHTTTVVQSFQYCKWPISASTIPD